MEPRKKGFSEAASQYTEKQRCEYLRVSKHPDHPDKKRLREKFDNKFKEFKQKYDD